MIKLNAQNAKIILQEYLPYVVRDDQRKITFWKGADQQSYRRMEQEPIELFGELATEWYSIFAGNFNPDARWDYYDGYCFKTESDAVLFKLRFL